jgi:hypothetical protein
MVSILLTVTSNPPAIPAPLADTRLAPCVQVLTAVLLGVLVGQQAACNASADWLSCAGHPSLQLVSSSRSSCERMQRIKGHQLCLQE